MKQKQGLVTLFMTLFLLLLSGCGSTHAPAEPLPPPPPAEATPPADTEPPENPVEKEEPEQVLSTPNKESIQAALQAAIRDLRQPPPMDISAAGLENPMQDVKNLYYMLLADAPELKVAYAITPAVSGKLLTCAIRYMPYQTGAFPDGFIGTPVSTLEELIAAATKNLAASAVDIRITNPSLEPDTMNTALQQAGGGYVVCALNADATQLLFTPPVGMTMEDALAALAEATALANGIVGEVLTEDMTEKEKATALYSTLTEQVKYDQRYYSDKANMPYASQTALGALRDQLAICGGYSHGVKLLFEAAGIPCYTVSGKYYGEYHMWNVAYIDGQWVYCDATSDRGSSAQIGFSHFCLTALDEQKYHFDPKQVLVLSE